MALVLTAGDDAGSRLLESDGRRGRPSVEVTRGVGLRCVAPRPSGAAWGCGAGTGMRAEKLADDLILLSDCPRPVGNRAACEEIASHGVRSLLVVDEDVTPWPSGQPGDLWCYVRPFACPRASSPSELQRVRDFVRFERAAGRTVALWIGYEHADCVAPDIVASARRAGRRLSGEEIDAGLYPGARFFFDTASLFRHPRAAWDGIHPVKIRDHLRLEPYLVAAVTSTVMPDGETLELGAPPELRERIVRLDHRKHRGLAAWSTAAFAAAAGRA